MTAYSKSSVQGRPARLGTETFTDNGTYVAIDFQNSQGKALDGFSSVVVNLPLGAKTITANGTYSASDDKLQGFSKVTVATPYEDLFSATGNITTLDLYITAARSKCFYGYDSLQSLVLRKGDQMLSTIQAALPTDLAQGTNLTIYVPETSVADYSALYSAYYTIKPLTEYGRYWYDIVTAATVLTSNLYVSAIQAFADTKDPYDGLRVPANITSIYSGALTPITNPASALNIHDLYFKGAVMTFASQPLVAFDSNFSNVDCPIKTFRYDGTNLKNDAYGGFFKGAYCLEYIYLKNWESPLYLVANTDANTRFNASSRLRQLIAPKLKSIANNQFAGAPLLEKASYPVATSVGNQAFISCLSLKSVSLPSASAFKTEQYWSGCFQGDAALEKVECLPFTLIGNSCFYGCSALASIPKFGNASSIGSKAFYNCSKLPSVDFTDSPTVPSLGATDAFTGTKSGFKVLVAYSAIADWWVATNWSALTSLLVGILKSDAAVTLDAIKVIDGIQYDVAWYTNPDLTGTAVSGNQPAGTYYAKLSI